MVTPDTISMLTYAPTLVMPVSPRDHILGSIDAPAVLVEYGDYECPYCKAAQPVVKAVKAAMGDELALVFRHFPLSNIHPFAWKAAEAAEAAGAQGMFWEYHDLLFEMQPALEIGDLIAAMTFNRKDGEIDVILISAKDGSIVRNLTSGIVLRSIDADGMRLSASFAVFQTLLNEPSTVFLCGRYYDRVIDDAGRMRFAERVCVADGTLVPTSLIFPL